MASAVQHRAEVSLHLLHQSLYALIPTICSSIVHITFRVCHRFIIFGYFTIMNRFQSSQTYSASPYFQPRTRTTASDVFKAKAVRRIIAYLVALALVGTLLIWAFRDQALTAPEDNWSDVSARAEEEGAGHNNMAGARGMLGRGAEHIDFLRMKVGRDEEGEWV
ncbi:hypothetical protein V1517DRAFT_320092, partial [Lipomyces orientalis]